MMVHDDQRSIKWKSLTMVEPTIMHVAWLILAATRKNGDVYRQCRAGAFMNERLTGSFPWLGWLGDTIMDSRTFRLVSPSSSPDSSQVSHVSPVIFLFEACLCVHGQKCEENPGCTLRSKLIQGMVVEPHVLSSLCIISGHSCSW